MSSTSNRAILMAVALAIALAPLASAALGDTKKPAVTATPASMTVDIVARSPSELEVFIEQIWVGSPAHHMRQSLDAFFGGADGSLTPSELDRIARATEIDMAAKTLDWIDLGGQPFTVTNATITFGNATGAINDTSELSMIHSLILTNTAGAPADRADIRVATRANGTLSILPPEGWHVASFNGLSAASTDARVTRGGIAEGGSVVLGVAVGEAPPDSSGNGTGTPPTVPTESASPGPDFAVPGAPIALVVAAGVGVALVLAGRRKR